MTSDENRELKRSLDEHREDTKVNFTAVRGEIAELRGEMQAGFAEVRAEFRAEMRAGFAEMRQHFKVLTEDLGGRIRLVAEGHAALDGKVTALDRRVTSVDQKVETLDLKVTALQGDVKSLHVGQGAIIAAVQQLIASE